VDASRGKDGYVVTHINNAFFPLQLLHDHFHDERLMRIAETNRWMYNAQTRVGRAIRRDQVSRNSGVSGWTDKSWRILRAEEVIFCVRTIRGGTASSASHRLLLLLLLSQEQRRDANIDNAVNARTDIDSDVS